jgi:drug/metabolite transporter (DMT)-like permease
VTTASRSVGAVSDTTLAVVLAIGAGMMYALASYFQHRGASSQSRELSLKWGLLAGLLRTPSWLVGTGLDLGAYGLEAVALAFGSLVVVQPLMVTGLLWALPLSTIGHAQRATRREWIPAVLLVASLAAFMVLGAPSGGRSNAPIRDWVVVAIAVTVVAGVLIGAARGAAPPRRAMLLAFAAGALSALTAALTKSSVALLGHGVGVAMSHWQPYALVAFGAVLLLISQSAFNAGHLVAALPALTVTTPVVGCIVGIALFGEHFDVAGAGAAVATAVAIGVMIVATVSLARSPLVTHDPDPLVPSSPATPLRA